MRSAVLVLLLLAGCAERPSIGITVTNAPNSLSGDCLPPKAGGGC